MELKVQCVCGQKYQFDVEPVNGQMPFTINCPLCGVDGTATANGILRETLPASTTPAPVPSGILAAAPAVTAPASAIALPPPSAGIAPPPVAAAASAPARLRINRPAAEAPATEPTAAAPAPPARPPVSRGFQRPAPAAAEKPAGSFAKGLLGALLGALIGSAIYFVLFAYTPIQFRLVGIAVGFLAGLGAQVLGKEGSNELGVITATLALLGIFGAQYFVAHKWWHESAFYNKTLVTYESSVREAKKVLAEIPTGSNAEIRTHLAKVAAKEMGEDLSDPDDVDDQDITNFRREDLPRYQDLASGKLTKEQFDEERKVNQKELEEQQKESEGTFKWFFMLLCLSKANLFSMVAAAALAYKMSTDA